MKLICVSAVAFLLFAAQVSADEVPALKTQKDKTSYGIGVDVARNFQRLGIDLDLDLMIKALRDVYGGGKLLMSEEELRTTMNTYRAELQSKQLEVMRRVGE